MPWAPIQREQGTAHAFLYSVALSEITAKWNNSGLVCVSVCVQDKRSFLFPPVCNFTMSKIFPCRLWAQKGYRVQKAALLCLLLPSRADKKTVIVSL